jgi:diguanylate cyclase (GGDEF)-like protein
MYFPPILALAVVALIGYLIGRRARPPEPTPEAQARQEIRRALSVARELERIAAALQGNLRQHEGRVERFKGRLSKLRDDAKEGNWKQLCKEAEDMLRPTLRLATQMSQAYDEIRQQSNQLMTFTEVRTDPLTGLGNRRALDESMASQTALRTRYGFTFSLVMFDIDHFKRINDQDGHLAGDRALQNVARLLDAGVRETDLVARYGGEEFVVLMPQTEVEMACLLAERLRQKVAEETMLTVSGGVAAIQEYETPHDLLSRADAALYAAKSAGRNRIFRHTSGELSHCVSEPPIPADDIRERETLERAARELAARRTMGDDRA